MTTKKIAIFLIILTAILVVLDAWLFKLFLNKPKTNVTDSAPNSTVRNLSEQELNTLKGKSSPLSEEGTELKEKVVNSFVRKERDYLVLKEQSQFTITYFSPPADVFYATITERPYDINRDLAEKWFLDQGFSSDELCNLGLTFLADSVVFDPQERRSASSRPTGCPEIETPE